MTRQDYLAFHRAVCEQLVAIVAKKNADYTGGTSHDDAFANFTEVALLDITSTEVGFLTRMSDKFARIRAFVKKGTLQVQDETVVDTLMDLANYSILLAGYIVDKRSKEGKDSLAIQVKSPASQAPGVGQGGQVFGGGIQGLGKGDAPQAPGPSQPSQNPQVADPIRRSDFNR